MEKEDRLSVEKKKGPVNDGTNAYYQVLKIQKISSQLSSEQQKLKDMKIRKLMPK